MNLNDFESYIDRKILARGYDYFENNCVDSIKETADNNYEAEVTGTELYLVDVELDDEANIIDTQCDCPYDMGEYCKHQVAVFLALRDMKREHSTKDSDGLKSKISLRQGNKSSVPQKGKARSMKDLLSRKTKEELVGFLLDIAAEYDEIKQRIELNLGETNDAEEIGKSIKLIRTFVNKNSDRHGFVAYGDTYEAVRGADMVLKKARTAMAYEKTLHALDLTLCVIHELMDLLDSCDDSDGCVGGLIEETLDFIKEIVEEKEFNLGIKEGLFNKLMEEAANTRYDGWPDWRLELLETCSALADIPSLRNSLENRLQAMLDDAAGDSWSSNYFKEKVFQIRYNVILQNEGEKPALEFIEQNLRFSSFRKMTIERAMQSKAYAEVIRLALEGEAKDQDLRGLVNNWREYRYKAYKLSGKLAERRGLAMDFILDGSFDYYLDLKSTYNDGEWAAVYPQIISRLEEQKKIYNGIYTGILIEEGEKKKLLEYVKGSPSLVESYYKHLVPEFREEVFALFLTYIEQAAARAGNRRAYQGVCAIIRNLKKAGGKDQALAIKQKLFANYANRPAFRDELTRV
ncbi:SWIM zinc finger family protein [Sporomusa acidovorans]|uniref:SWIM-type domain-containing protein n=1 Tax=Sporomusa acidovorans (strain ATCC 49682 / DSM 3132 / Mol) TaxID=1123286 RepID=A0ABZ3JA09_SPOA4|nr:SWIM zinc finger family protein [Sporomusa acidovorans]OZC17378.1 SWIM zinc finger protein [Sporomusa acidovorans DSM 3132]SDF67312.1 SWIM zinc finger [Sporomusa acidovorans]